MKKNLKETWKNVNELKTVKTWKMGCEIYGEVMTIICGVKTLPLVVVAGAAEVGYKKTKEHIEKKQEERFGVLMEQYKMNMNGTTL